MKINKDVVKKFNDTIYTGCETSVATVGFVLEDGTLINSNNQACHAGLRSGAYKIKQDNRPLLSYVISGVQKAGRGSLDEGVKEAFIDWMIKKSPYRSTIVNKSVGSVLRNHWWFDVNTPMNVMSGGAIATRLISEWPNKANIWYRMVKLGCNPSEAFTFTPYFRGTSASISVDDDYGGHQAVCGLGQKYMSAFVNGKPVAPGGIYKTELSYGGIGACWGQGSNFPHTLKNFIPPSKKTRNLNIFKKTTGQAVFTTDEDVLFLYENLRSVA